jgi:hypothetical protein
LFIQIKNPIFDKPTQISEKMEKKSNALISFILCALFFSAISLNANSQGKVKFEYGFKKAPVSYVSSTNAVQSMDFSGMSMQVNVTMVLGTTVTAAVAEGESLKLKVMIDSMLQSIETPQGNVGGNIADVKGKSFAMVLSTSGKETDLTEAQKITYSADGNSQVELAQTFSNFFPDLPKNPVAPGESWTSRDTLKNKFSSASNTDIIESNNKFEGFETVDGIECAKITSIVKGSRQQNAQTMGMDIVTTGDFTGTEELYFNIKDGYLVKQVSNSKMNGTIEISGPQSMTAPLTMDMTSTTKIKK